MNEIVICHPIRGGERRTTFLKEDDVLLVASVLNDYGPRSGQTIFRPPEVWATAQEWAEARAQAAPPPAPVPEQPAVSNEPHAARPFQLEAPAPKRKTMQRSP